MATAQRFTPELPDDSELLARTWVIPKGFLAWFTQVNHRVIGRRFIVTAFVFFLLGGIEGLLMRIQLGTPESTFLDPDTYNQIFTMHGTTMMFFFAVPVLEGFGIYLLPLMFGTRDMAFPRLNAFGYYVYLIAGIVLYGGFFLGQAPDAGWFNYVPLSGREFSPGIRIDLWATMITFIEVSALVAAVELVVTIFKQRPPGMTINRMPLFAWAMLVTSFMIIFAMPAVMLASVMLAMDRMIDTSFFVPREGGDAILWQHLFWFFGHPEVYIILLPGLGFVSHIVITFSRRPVFGYTAIVLALVATGIVSFGLWVHHMYTAGIPLLGSTFFTMASVMIAIPSGVQIFCWLATLWNGRPVFATPLLYVIGFVIIFVMGGVTGVMVASVPLDMQVHDTFFVVAHFHYVLIGGSVFPLLGAVHYWFPKLAGRMLSERLGKLAFWLLFVGFNVTFFPMHQLGLEGMPRRVYTYIEPMGWGTLNLVATTGAFMLAAGVLVLILNVIQALLTGTKPPNDPWGADTLEWETESAPPSYNFLHTPVVRSRYPLWDRRATGDAPVVFGERKDRREVLITSVLDAEPQYRAVLPGPSWWPILLALATSTAFLGAIESPIFVPIGAFLAFVILALWHWPGEHERTPPWRGGTEEER